MDKETREQIKEEQIAIYGEEISKIENAIKILKERYELNLADLEKKLDAANFQKDVFEESKI